MCSNRKKTNSHNTKQSMSLQKPTREPMCVPHGASVKKEYITTALSFQNKHVSITMNQ